MSEIFQLLKAALWPIPLRRDLLSQANGTIWHPRPELWTLHVWLLNGSLSAFHAPIAGRLVGRNSGVVQFLRGARRMNPLCPHTVPHWDFPTVLRALKGPPFESLQSTSLGALSLKTALLLALASVPGRAMSCTPQSLLLKKSEMLRRRSYLYSQTPHPFWRAMAGCIAIGLCATTEPLVCFLGLHEPMDVQFHCVIYKRLQLKRKT